MERVRSILRGNTILVDLFLAAKPNRGAPMSDSVDLYNHAYGKYEQDMYAQIRIETYGRDLGQTSWVTSEESDRIPGLLAIGLDSKVLEIGFGSGRYAIYLAERTGCRVTGLDINEHGVHSACEFARANGLSSRVEFRRHNVTEGLPFADATFDAVYANDVLCHVKGRESVLREAHRVLRPGGRILFSDALVIGGIVSSEEIAVRSSIGFYLFTIPGRNEQLLQTAGFHLLEAIDTTENAALIAKRWHDARRKRELDLISAEGAHDYGGLQRFLQCVHELTNERRLLRWLYVGVKP
jgi:SAM-dependent methyltransferase